MEIFAWLFEVGVFSQPQNLLTSKVFHCKSTLQTDNGVLSPIFTKIRFSSMF